MCDLLVQNSKFKSINEMFGLNDSFNVIAGPCAVESIEQMEKTAVTLTNSGIRFIRGGAYKPRTSPYSFQGLGKEGLEILHEVKNRYNLLAVSEIMDTRDVELGVKYLDVIQIGSRNMFNYSLLKEVGRSRHPVLLKRGMMATVKEFLLAAEYIYNSGNENIIMCERGIRSYDNSTRNVLDISCIAIIKQETSLPVIADLSHSLGRKDIIFPVAKAVLGVGADGIMIETHINPSDALSDNEQQLAPHEFMYFMDSLNELKGVFHG